MLITGSGLAYEIVQRRRDKHRGQAERVVSWVEEFGPATADQSDYWSGAQIGDVMRLRFFNGSDLPVFQFGYRLSSGVRGTFVGWRMGGLAPRSTWETWVPLGGYTRATPRWPEISFVDAGGRKWHRTADGTLHQGTEMFAEENPFEPQPHPTLGLERPWLRV